MKNKGKNVVAKYLTERVIDEALIKQSPDHDLKMIIVVPSYKEKVQDVFNLCSSLSNQLESINFELVIVVNNAIGDKLGKEINQILLSQLDRFGHFKFPIHFIDKSNIENSKKAGVGFARKIGLDEGLRRFDSLGREGILVCLDADCMVAQNYLKEIDVFFTNYPKLNACSIGFKHRLEEIEDEKMLQAIIQYELHLRYYIQIQEWVGLPFAFQTVGSAMAVRSRAYAAQGGMPVLKAGEDFYFLHKFIGTRKCGNLRESLVFPSGRISDRVPFGTGRAVGEIIANTDHYLSYHPASFKVLKGDLETIVAYYPQYNNICESIHESSQGFYKSIELESKLLECVKHTSDKASFVNRFFRWFDAFKLMKYVHYMRDKHFENIKVLDAVNLFLKIKGVETSFSNEMDALQHLQMIDYPSEELA